MNTINEVEYIYLYGKYQKGFIFKLEFVYMNLMKDHPDIYLNKGPFR